MSDTTHISETVSAGQLRAFIERIERLEEEIKTLNGEKSEVYKEMRGVGFDVKAVRQCVAARKLDSAEREERDAIFDLYWSALTGSVHVHTPAREIIEEFPSHDPETGEITDTQEQPETRGFFAGLTDEQQAEALAYRGDETHGGEADGREVEATAETRLSAPIPHSSATSSQVAAEQTGAAVTPPVAAPVDKFVNPRCQKPGSCHFTHNRSDECEACRMAWSQRPRDEQIRLWSEANEAARAA